MSDLEFQTNVDNVYTKLYGFACKLTKNENDANDLYQETCYKAYKAKNTFRTESNFKAWITTIMYNTFVNFYNKRRRRNVASEPVEALAYNIENESFPSMISQLTEKEILKKVNRLKEKYRYPLKMFIAGYKYKEIAEEHDIPMGTVKSRINYARNIIKKEFQVA